MAKTTAAKKSKVESASGPEPGAGAPSKPGKKAIISYFDPVDEADLEFLAKIWRKTKSAVMRDLVHEAAKLERELLESGKGGR